MYSAQHNCMLEIARTSNDAYAKEDVEIVELYRVCHGNGRGGEREGRGRKKNV